MFRKIVTVLIIIMMTFPTVVPTAEAINENVLKNETAENILYEENEDNIINNEGLINVENEDINDNVSNNFEMLLAGALMNVEPGTMTISDVSSIIMSKPLTQGVWIEESSREYILNLINSLTNKVYKIDEDGFLVEDIENQKLESELKNNYQLYTDKIDELINSEKTIILSIKEFYNQINEIDNDIISINIEDDEYALLFKDNDQDENNENDIIILNTKKYNDENTDNTINFLMNKLLEVYYHENDEFIDFVNNDIYIDEIEDVSTNTIIDEEIENELDNTIIDSKTNENTEVDEEIVDNDEEIIKRNEFDDRVTEKEYNLIMAGILSEDVTTDNIEEILIDKPSRNGIWISPNSRTIFLDFLNAHTIYTYSVDNEGYLICDNMMKDNENLDIIEKAETEVDIELKNVLEKEMLIVIDIANQYLKYNDEEITSKNLGDEEFALNFSYNENRIVLLNSNYYIDSNYNLALSDYFIKSLQNIPEKVLEGELSKKTTSRLRSDTDKYGYMSSAQTVYAGPSSSDYATVGSVSYNEKVYILGKQNGWYHIQYIVTGSLNQKSGFVPISTVTNIVGVPHEEQMTGGMKYASSSVNIRSCDDFSIAVSLGSVFAGEGVTVLYSYTYHTGYQVSYVEVSTSTKTKRGYVYTSELSSPNYPTSVARVIETSSAYSGPDGGRYVKMGGTYYNEFVSILAKDGDWVYVEYNTTSGRKRGYMLYSKLYNYNHPGEYNRFANHKVLKQATQGVTVYGAPNSNNANIGSVFNQEVISYLETERGYAYIEYTTSTGAKRGYVNETHLINASTPSIPNIPTYNGFTIDTYGTSGLGQDLKYYKIGSGSNVVFAVFEQHGWEDAWAYDGVELIKIADRVMQTLSTTDQSIFNNWTLYLIPYANPDGITNGFTNSGPGRCTYTTKVDMNRCWPAKFTPYYTSGNYTGMLPLGAPEALKLKSFLESNESSNGTTILLDMHGWLNKSYGSSQIGAYFTQQFGFSHSSTYGSGYLISWGLEKGYKSCLIEFPMPSSPSAIISDNYSGKLATGMINMMAGIDSSAVPEGGTTVNESVRVFSTGNVNIRNSPTTSSSVVANISNGTMLTRIKKGVTTANGYTWDKVILNDGAVGYIATNFLVLVEENKVYMKYNLNDDIKVIKAYLRYNDLYYDGIIDNIYDSELIGAIEEFQKFQTITVDGELNRNTLLAMGFTVGNDGMVVQDSYYSKYTGISYNYINKNPHDLDNGKKFLFGKQLSQLDSAYVNLRDRENGKYDSYSDFEKQFKLVKMLQTESELNRVINDFENKYTKSAQALSRYLENTGNELKFSEINSIFWITNQKNLRNTYIERAMRASEGFINNYNNSARFALDYCYATNIGLDILDENRLDWYAAANSISMGISANTERLDNGYYRMVINFTMRDYYDWGEDFFFFPTLPVTIIQEEDIRDLHYAGRAKNFETTGPTHEVLVIWQEGHSIDNAIIEVI